MFWMNIKFIDVWQIYDEFQELKVTYLFNQSK